MASIVNAKGNKHNPKEAGIPHCQKKVMSFVTKDYIKLTAIKLKDNFVCNKLPEMDHSCCRKEEY
jgi:hypothetical protein